MFTDNGLSIKGLSGAQYQHYTVGNCYRAVLLRCKLLMVRQPDPSHTVGTLQPAQVSVVF